MRSSNIFLFFNCRSRQNHGRTIQRLVGGHLELRSATDGPVTTAEAVTIIRPSHNIIYPRVNSTSKLPYNRDQRVFFKRKTLDDQNKIRGSASSLNLAVDNIYSKEFNGKQRDEENNLDYGLMQMSAAGEGNNSTNDELSSSGNSGKKDESKKTLSDQIAEGKYGLIEKELFSKVPKRPGVISYSKNNETPDDNDKTFGGLDQDDIWLAEDHLLVLRGGSFNRIKNNNEFDNGWKPIDDYEAPKRPVKIPLNGKVAPPFPVQLEKGGPVQFIGVNQFALHHPLPNESGLQLGGKAPPQIQADGGHKTDFFAGYGAQQNATKAGFLYPSPFYPPGGSPPSGTYPQISDVIPPWLFNDTHSLKNFNLPFPPPMHPNIEQILKNGNNTDEFDEDDPSLYYPPPYSFKYRGNYTDKKNLVPPGPLVPGIILPPPPDFFEQDHEYDSKNIKTPLDVLHRINEIHLKNKLASSTTQSPSSTTVRITPKTKKPIYVPGSTPIPPRIYKIKSTTLRPSVPPQIVYSTYSTTPSSVTTSSKYENVDKYRRPSKYDTTTLRLRPVYNSQSTTTTTQAPRTSSTTPKPAFIEEIKEYKHNEIHSQTPKTILTKVVPFNEQPQEIISFIPKPPKNSNKGFGAEYGNSGNPIYFEYFDARTANPVPEAQQPKFPVYSTYKTSYQPIVSTTARPLHEDSIRISKKPKNYFSYPQQFVSSTTPSSQNFQSYDYDKFLYITPRPDIYSNGSPEPVHIQRATETPIPLSYLPIPAVKAQRPLILKPYKSFDDEIDSIRSTLSYYSRQKFIFPPEQPLRTPKAKAVYEYAFDATKIANPNAFKPPAQLDNAPFRPMLSYSQTNGDSYYNGNVENSAKNKKNKNSYTTEASQPAPYYYSTSKVPQDQAGQIIKASRQNDERYNPQVLRDFINYNNDRYYQTSTNSPIKYYKASPSQATTQTVKNPNKTSYVFGQKIRQSSHNSHQNHNQNNQPMMQQYVQQPPQKQNQQFTIEKQVFKEVTPKPLQILNYQQESQRYELPRENQQQPYRTNNRHMSYRKPPQAGIINSNVQNQNQKYNDEAEYLKQFHYASEVGSLLNDTRINYQYPQRPINPYSEFIDITNIHPHPEQTQQHLNYQHHNAHNYNQNNQQKFVQTVYPANQQHSHLAQQYPHKPQQQVQYVLPLDRDILVNYKNPLPQINPGSVSITSPSTVFNRPMANYKKLQRNDEMSDERFYADEPHKGQ